MAPLQELTANYRGSSCAALSFIKHRLRWVLLPHVNAHGAMELPQTRDSHEKIWCQRRSEEIF